jgi:hypothetical protein
MTQRTSPSDGGHARPAFLTLVRGETGESGQRRHPIATSCCVLHHLSRVTQFHDAVARRGLQWW